jgi:hypothetical protein
MFMQVDVAFISSSRWRAKLERWKVPEVSASIAIYRSQAESIDGVFDGKTVASRQEIQECQGLIRAGDK